MILKIPHSNIGGCFKIFQIHFPTSKDLISVRSIDSSSIAACLSNAAICGPGSLYSAEHFTHFQAHYTKIIKCLKTISIYTYYVSNKRSLFTLRGFTITSKSIGFSGMTGDVFSQVMFEFWSSRYLKHSLQMSAEQYEPISVGSTQRTHSQPKCLPIEQMMSAWDTFYIRNCTI